MQRPRIVKYRGKWEAYIRLNGTSNRFSLGNLDATPENYPAAERALEDLSRQLVGEVADTISEIVEGYLRCTDALSKDRMQYAWKVLKPFWGNLNPNHITKEKCVYYAAGRRAQGCQPATIRKELSVLRAAINWAKKGHEADFAMPAPPPPKDRWLTKSEFKALLSAAKCSPHLVLFLHLAIATGGRKEALLQLKWDQVEFRFDYIKLGVKEGGKPRATVPMTSTLKAVLERALEERQTDFVIEFAGKPVNSLRRSFDNAVKRAGLSEDAERVNDFATGVASSLSSSALMRHSSFLAG